MRVLFLHGLHSHPNSRKARYLQEHGCEVVAPKLDADDFDKAVRAAFVAYSEENPDVVVGSSRGGAVAMALACRFGVVHTPTVLICPAWRQFRPDWRVGSNLLPLDFPKKLTVLHSPDDDVIPVEDSLLLPAEIQQIGKDHRMNDEESLRAMLEAVNESAR